MSRMRTLGERQAMWVKLLSDWPAILKRCCTDRDIPILYCNNYAERRYKCLVICSPEAQGFEYRSDKQLFHD
jgi:hypothetical protein